MAGLQLWGICSEVNAVAVVLVHKAVAASARLKAQAALDAAIAATDAAFSCTDDSTLTLDRAALAATDAATGAQVAAALGSGGILLAQTSSTVFTTAIVKLERSNVICVSGVTTTSAAGGACHGLH